MVWIIISIIVVLVCMVFFTLLMTRANDDIELYDKISFKEALDLTDLPVITFNHNLRKLNFLLDTGASKSIINTKELTTCSYKVSEDKNQLTGMDGITRTVDNVVLTISYKDNDFEEMFQSTDMSASFDNIKKVSGVSIHGVLGNTFFQKYKYIIDFNELVAYNKSIK